MANNSLKLFAVLLIASSTLLVLAGSMDVENRCCNRRCQVSTKLIKEIQKKYYECNVTKAMCKELSTLFTYTKNKLNGILNKEYKASDNHCSGDNCPEAGGLLTDAAEMYDLAVSHECLFARTCNKITELFNETMAQLGSILTSCPGPNTICRSVNYDAINPKNPKGSFSVSGAVGLIINGNDLYVGSYTTHTVYRYDMKRGANAKPLESTKTVKSYTYFFDINDGYLYVATYGAAERKPLKGGKFEVVTRVGRHGSLKWTRDGKFLLVSNYNNNKFQVFNKQLKKVTDISATVAPYQKMLLISKDRMIVTNRNKRNELLIFGLTKGTGYNYKFLGRKVIQSVSYIYGGLVLCNGDIILGCTTKVIVLNKDLKTIKVISGFSNAHDIALAADGTLYVSDYGASKVYLFSVY